MAREVPGNHIADRSGREAKVHLDVLERLSDLLDGRLVCVTPTQEGGGGWVELGPSRRLEGVTTTEDTGGPP
ncbi:MAG: hypothetical protein ACRDV9_06330 [Acidimicrobiia bacterium]